MARLGDDDMVRAIERTKAIRVSSVRFAIPGLTLADGWHTTSEEGVIRSAFDEDAPDDLYVEMPDWWSPEQQFAFGIDGEPYGRKSDGSFHRYETRKEAEYRAETDDGTRDPGVFRVTIDLETGQEISA